MNRAYGLNIPQTLEEVCDPQRLALLVYDMQVGILSPMLICITSPFTIATFRNVAPLQLRSGISSDSQRGPHAPHEVGEPRIAADCIPHWVVFIKNSDRSRC
jgi:hypothetical protein